MIKFSKLNPTLITEGNILNFVVNEWSLVIWADKMTCKFCFPKVIKISFETLPSSPSLLWVIDQDEKPAVFTYGAVVNNRSLFPCQEPPVAMATWEAFVTTSNSTVVLMSGDEEPQVSLNKETTEYYFYTKKTLPLSTLCLAIGSWKEHVIARTSSSCPKCKIFAPSSLIDSAVQELFEYVPYCLMITEDMLGPYPFPRIDFLIVPSTFGSLGMASPHVVFLSQSLLSGDGSMRSRISHEIAHGWFGLHIGALDWTEEWLSEGFATFVEDYVHAWTVNMSESNGRDYRELRSFIRRKTLLEEVKNSGDELQILRSSKGKADKSLVDGIEATVLKNSQNPLKGFMQVHYIKGYFLLKYLSDAVGTDSFFGFLRAYIKEYGGHLVTSVEFLTMFVTYFPLVTETMKVDVICENWLHNPGIPEFISELEVSQENKLFQEVINETNKWMKLNNMLLKKQPKRRKFDQNSFSSMTGEQMILFLENLLEVDTFSTNALRGLNEAYNFKNSNAEVQHRWFELVVKHKYKNEYASLRKFLRNHLAMGVYLYGEMIFSSETSLKNIAEECFHSLESEMEPNYQSMIRQMMGDSE